MLAADLSSILPPGEERARQLEPLAELRAAHPELPPGGELPAFCSAWFSPHALFTRFGIGEKAAVERAYLDFPRAYVAIARRCELGAPPSDSSAVARAQARYLADHRAEDRGLKMLDKLFGTAWASRYVQHLLFPVEEAL
jgi:phycocyanobilin:ferredoxin oxidoreductase